jgi:hypothetical protein
LGKYHSKNKTNRLPPFVPLIWDLLNSPAYKKLTPSAAKALPYFLGKVKVKYNDPEKYEKIFPFSYPEAEKLGFSTATFSRIHKELEEKGFIERAERGGLRGKSEGYSKYRLSRKWESYGKETTVPTEKVEWTGHKPRLIRVSGSSIPS